MNTEHLQVPGPAYRIHTQRAVVRCWEPKDAALLKTTLEANFEHLHPWMPWATSGPQDLQEKLNYIRHCRGEFDLGNDFIYGIFNSEESLALGGCGLHTRLGTDAREIGYWIHHDYINQGLATEIAAALTKVAFEVDRVERIEIHCDSANVRSAAIPRKLGYTHEATLLRRVRNSEGNLRDAMIWSLFAQDYPLSPSASTIITAFDATGRKII